MNHPAESLAMIDALTARLTEMEFADPGGSFTLLDVYGRSLAACRYSIEAWWSIHMSGDTDDPRCAHGVNGGACRPGCLPRGYLVAIPDILRTEESPCQEPERKP